MAACPVVIRPNAFAGDLPFVFEGPITRTVEDAALALNALSGYDPRDPLSLDDKVDFSPQCAGRSRGMRIGYSADFDVFPVDPRIAASRGGCRPRLRAGRRHVEPVKLGIKPRSASSATPGRA